MGWEINVGRFAWIIFVTLACVESRSGRPDAPRPQTDPSEDPLRTCWAEAKANRSNLAEFGLVDPVLRWSPDQQWLALKLRFQNKSPDPIWLNKRATSDSPDTFRDITIHIEAPPGALQRSEGEGDRGPATAADYVLVGSGDAVDMVTKINNLNYALPAGKYRLAVCFWDRNPMPPIAPRGARRFEQALAASPVELIREATPAK